MPRILRICVLVSVCVAWLGGTDPVIPRPGWTLGLSSAASSNCRVERRRLTRTLTLSGDLEAVERLTVTAPSLTHQGNHSISYLAPEGKRVEPGEILVQFDASGLETRRLELERQREEARIKVAQSLADLESRRQDVLLNLAGAERAIKTAELFVGIDPQLLPAADAERYRYDHDKARIEIDKVNRQLNTLEETGAAELKVARLELDRSELELRRVETDLAALTIRASSPGVVLYEDHFNRAGKVQAGDSVWRGQHILNIPNPERMLVRAAAYDADYPLLRVGLDATVILDAVPERTFSGKIIRVSETARPRNFRSQLRAFAVDVLLDETRSELMKPGMTARLRIPVAVPEGLVVSRECVGLLPEGSAFVATTEAPPRRVPIRIFSASETEVAFQGDLIHGTEVRIQTGVGGRRGGGAVDWLRLEKDDYLFYVGGSGTVEAERNVLIGPPLAPNIYQYKIVALAPEGIQVEPGDLLVAFDPSEIQKSLMDEGVALAKVEEEIDRTRASQEIGVKDLGVRLEEAKVQDEKARNKLVLAREFESDLKVRQAEYDAEFAGRQAAILARKLEQVQRQAELQLQILEDRRRLHAHRIAHYRKTVADLQVTAPRRGVVIYQTNWRNEKKEIGSNVYLMDKVLSLPDMDTLVVRGQVAEVDAGSVFPGQEVQITFDATPERSYRGTVRELANVFRTASVDRPVKVLDVVVSLESSDVSGLRPGMAARLQLITARFNQVLALPLTAIQIVNGEAGVWVRSGGKVERRPVVVGEDNGMLAVIEQGLEAGVEVAARPPEAEVK